MDFVNDSQTFGISLDFELLCELALCIENEQPTVHLRDATRCSDLSATGLEECPETK
jgi:hypothetical protein